MFIFKAAFCRIFQACFRAALPVLPYREPTLIRSCEDLDSVFEKVSPSAALIITDRGVVQHHLTDGVENALEKRGIPHAVYDKTSANPTVSNVEEALEIFCRSSANCLIAVGGGSAIDCAKAVGARSVYPEKNLDKLKGMLRVMRHLPTLIAVPTTAGTGSEATLAAVISDPTKHEKYALMSFPLIPHYAVLDASLTRSLPAHLTSSTGIDALTHAVEAYIGRSTTADTRSLSIEAVKLIFENIEPATADPNDISARENMLTASYKADVAFTRSYVGYVHAIAHALGGMYNVPHGLANAVILPYVLKAYGSSVSKKLHRLGTAVGICNAEDSDIDGCLKFISAIESLLRRLKIPTSIREIREEDIKTIARHAESEANPLYPVPRLMTCAELETIIYDASELKQKSKD